MLQILFTDLSFIYFDVCTTKTGSWKYPTTDTHTHIHIINETAIYKPHMRLENLKLTVYIDCWGRGECRCFIGIPHPPNINVVILFIFQMTHLFISFSLAHIIPPPNTPVFLPLSFRLQLIRMTVGSASLVNASIFPEMVIMSEWV